MKGIVRLAMTYFAMVPVQRWINGAGLVLLALATAMLVLEKDHSAQNTVILFVLGTLLLVLTPAVGGGIALRQASTRSLVHLRPNGRARLLVATTLTITVLAALGTLPAMVVEWFPQVSGSPGSRHTTPLEMFEVGWTIVALCWIAMFAISRSLVMFALIGLLPVIAVQAGRYIVPLFPSTAWVLALGIVAWGAFGLWYLRTGYIHRQAFPVMGSSDCSSFDNTPLARLADLGAPKGEPTRAQATHYHLFGCASPMFYAVTGAWVAALFGLVTVFSNLPARNASGQLLGMLPFFSFFHATLGYTTARRARFLWLRGGMDRTQLFSLADRWGLKCGMAAWAIPGGMTLAVSLLLAPERALISLIFVVQQAVFAAAMYYAGIALIRGWTFTDVLLCIGMPLLFILSIAVAIPVQTNSPGKVAGTLAVAAVVVLLLRALAAWRWRSLDWRIARPSRLGMGR